MTKQELKDQLPVLTAWACDNAKIQRQGTGGMWHDVKDMEGITIDAYPIRIKPEPREWFLFNGLVYFTFQDAVARKTLAGPCGPIIHVREVI